VILYGGESINPRFRHQHHKQHFIIPTRDQINLIHSLIIQPIIGLNALNVFSLIRGGSSDDGIVCEICCIVGDDGNLIQQLDQNELEQRLSILRVQRQRFQ
jgi:hypothetical protein